MYYRIENSSSSVVLGYYKATTEADALDAMARDAGYADYAEAHSVAPGDVLVTAVHPPRTLRALRDVLNDAPRDADQRERYALAHGLPTKHGEIAYDDLPTFGGDSPLFTDGVYSWSDGQLLVRADAYFGEGNQLNGGRMLQPWTLVPRDPTARLLSQLITEADLSVSAFARAIGRDRGTVEAWLTGEQVITEVMRRWVTHATVARVSGGVQITVAD